MEGYISYLCVYLLLMIDDAAAGGGLSLHQKRTGGLNCSSVAVLIALLPVGRHTTLSCHVGFV